MAEPSAAAESPSAESPSAEPSKAARGGFVPLLITACALLVWSGFETYQLWLERASQMTIFSNQEAPIAEGKKIRASFEKLLGDIGQLADAGNPGARAVAEELRKRGITATPPAGGQATQSP